MARNRMIRPEQWSKEPFVELSPNARLLYLGLWNFCDDGGNHPASVKSAKMEIFPGDDLTAAQVSDLVQEIIAQRLIMPYEAENAQYWHISDWENLQKIEKPTYQHPPFAEQSPSSRRAVAENTQVKEVKEVKERKEASERNARAHEENFEKQKTVTTAEPSPTPPQPSNGGGGGNSDPYTHCLHQINLWARPDNWQPLRDYADSVGYHPERYGPVADEVKKFTAHWLDPKRHPDDRTAFQADPARFFQEKGRKWLLDAKTMNKTPKQNGNKYQPPSPHQRQPRTNNGNATPTTIGDIAGKIITEISA